MAQSVIGALRVNLGLDAAEFRKGASKAQVDARKAGRRIKQAFAIGAAALAAMSAASVAGARDIDETAKSARRLGGSIGGFEAVKLAAGEAGVSLSSLPNEIQNINRELANIGVTGNADRALEKLGLTLADLDGLDVDEKLALIADRVKALGLSSGETTALLRDLGVRNREMVLLFQQGGDAIRAARKDIKDFGLEISESAARRVEEANDRIARLSMIGRAAGQSLAQALIPAVGALANAIMESLRPGGMLRDALEAVRIVAMGSAVVVTGMYVPALTRAAWATGVWVASLITLRGALIATGIGALIVVAGVLVDFLIRLRSSTDSWAEAWGLLKDVANESLERIGYGALALEHAVTATWLQIKTSFLTALADMGDGWRDFASLVGSAMMVVPGMGIAGQKLLEGAANSGGLRDAANAAAGNYIQEIAAADALWQAAKRPMQSLKALRDSMDGTADSTSGATEEARKLNAELDDMGGSGGKAGKAASSMKEMADDARNMASHFDGLITDGKKFGGVLQSIARQLESSAWQQLFSGLGGGLGGLLGGGGAKKGLFGLGGLLGFLDGGGRIGAGQWAIAGERGPEIVSGPANVTSRAETARMMQQGEQPARVEVAIGVDESGNIIPIIQRESGNVVARAIPQAVSTSVKEVDRRMRQSKTFGAR